MVLARLQNGLVHKGMAKWTTVHRAELLREQQEFERERNIQRLKERIARRIKNLTLSASWNKWFSEVKSSKRYRALLKRAHARWTKRSMAASFHRWSVEVQERKRHFVIIQRFGARIRNREAYQAFSTWRAVAEDAIRMRGMLKKAALKWQNAFVASAMVSWVEFTQARKRARFLARKIIKKMQNQTLNKGFTLWTHHTIIARMSRNDLDAENERLRAKLEASKQQHKVEQLRKLLRHIQGSFLHKAWATWRSEVEERHRLEVLLRRSATKIMHRDLSQAFDFWSEVVQERMLNRTRVRKVIARIKQLKEAAALTRWKELVRQRVFLRVFLRKVVWKLENKETSRAWNSWNLFVINDRLEMRLREAAAKKLGGSEDRIRFLEEQMRVHKLRSLYTIITRMQNMALSRGMRMWKEVNRKKQLIERSIKRWQLKLASKTFNTWASAVQKTKRDKLKIKWVLQRMHRHLIFKAFAGWKNSFLNARRMKHIARKAAGKWRNRTLAAAFHAWQSTVHETLRHKALIRKSMFRWQKRHLSTAFQSWNHLVERRKHARHLIKMLVLRYENKELYKGWIPLKMLLARVVVSSPVQSVPSPISDQQLRPKRVGGGYVHQKVRSRVRPQSAHVGIVKSLDLIQKKTAELYLRKQFGDGGKPETSGGWDPTPAIKGIPAYVPSLDKHCTYARSRKMKKHLKKAGILRTIEREALEQGQSPIPWFAQGSGAAATRRRRRAGANGFHTDVLSHSLTEMQRTRRPQTATGIRESLSSSDIRRFDTRAPNLRAARKEETGDPEKTLPSSSSLASPYVSGRQRPGLARSQLFKHKLSKPVLPRPKRIIEVVDDELAVLDAKFQCTLSMRLSSLRKKIDKHAEKHGYLQHLNNYVFLMKDGEQVERSREDTIFAGALMPVAYVHIIRD